MKYTTTKKELVNTQYKRISLLKDWKKAKDSAQVEVCTHTLIDWDCGCSEGCDMCKLSYTCTECNSKFNYSNKNVPTVKLI